MKTNFRRSLVVVAVALALAGTWLSGQNYSISPRSTKYAVVLEYAPDTIKVAQLDITFFGPVDAKKEEAFVRLQAEEARKRIPGDVDIFIRLYSQPPGQREKTIDFPDGSSFLLYRGMKLYSERTDPQFGKK